MKTIAVVIPTIRPESMKTFLKAWEDLFVKHDVILVTVWDGDKPYLTVKGKDYLKDSDTKISAKEIMGDATECLSNYVAAIRNLGFAYVAKHLPNIEYIITLDDDETPVGDPIEDHINIMKKRVPVSWISTASEYTRGYPYGVTDNYPHGFPYGIREEAEVVLSHGVWVGVADWDAPTQLVLGSKRKIDFYKGVIPRGIYYPMCSMNLAFKRKMLPFIYHAPKALGVVRANDIFAGILSKREIDKRDWAAVSGYATVNHDRASNVFKNLREEAVEIELYETFWKGDEKHPYFKIYREKYKIWQDFIKTCPVPAYD